MSTFDSVDESIIKGLGDKEAVKLLHKLIYAEAKRLAKVESYHKLFVEGASKTDKIGNKEEAEKICNQVLINLRARIRADEARKGVKKDSKSNKKKPLPDKVTDWCTFPRYLCEIYVVEGDSAGGSAKQGADKRFQAIMPTKGKILNVEKQKIGRVLASETLEIFNDAIGVSLNIPYKEKDLNYGKIIIMSDADELNKLCPFI
jgi:DNA gyrase/topoisomerase IV subunit B